MCADGSRLAVVVINTDGTRIIKYLTDPRVEFCREFNSRFATSGMRAIIPRQSQSRAPRRLAEPRKSARLKGSGARG